jgi:RecB family endonuclease NucS
MSKKGPAPELPEVQPEGSSGETLNQRRMREALEAKEQLTRWKEAYDRKYADIKHLIQTGAEIQAGKIGTRHGIRFVRRPRYKQLLIDAKGEAYQKKCLEQTEPHAHFFVRLIPPKPKKGA